MSDQPASLAAALAALQADLPFVPKDATATVPGKDGKRGFSYDYADLATLSRIILPRLSELGLVWVCKPEMRDDKFGLTFMLLHVNEVDRIEGFWPIALGTPQAMGGAVTYARRYCLLAVTGVAPDEDDDDAQAAEAEARELSRRPPETRPDGSVTFAEQERMLHDRAGWTQEAPQRPLRTEWDAEPPTQPDPRTSALRAMFALYRELEVTEKDDMLLDIGGIVSKPVESRADLSLEEITAVNGVLRKRRDAKRAAESVTT